MVAVIVIIFLSAFFRWDAARSLPGLVRTHTIEVMR